MVICDGMGNAPRTIELFFIEWTKNIHSNSYFSIVLLQSKLELKAFNSFILTLGEIFTVMPEYTVSWLAKDKWMQQIPDCSSVVQKLQLVISQTAVDEAFLSTRCLSVRYLRVLHQKWEKAWKARSWSVLSCMVSSHFCFTGRPNFSCAIGWEENGIQ